MYNDLHVPTIYISQQSSIASCGHSKWSAFIQPQDSEEDIDNDDIYRTSSTEFEQVYRRIRGQKGNAKYVKWMDGWMDGWVGGWIDELTIKYTLTY